MKIIVIIFAALVVAWTILPLLRHQAWWIRVFEFPRIQLVVLALGGITATAVVFDSTSKEALLLYSVLFLCTIFHLRYIWPYTAMHQKQVKQAVSRDIEAEISILVGNVLMSNRRQGDFLKIIKQQNPDLVLAVETDLWWETELEALQAEYPYSVKHPLDNFYGMHLYSKLKLIDPKLLFLVQDGIPSIHTTVALRSGRLIQLHCLHPAPPSPTENETSIERDAELLTVAKTIDATTQSVIVAGDLNDVAWSATTRLFHKTSQLLDPRVGRGMFNTFHAKLPFFRWPLDHVFHSADFELIALERLPAFGSDHFPIFAALQLKAAPPLEHDIPEPSADEHELADKKIDKADIDEVAAQEIGDTSFR